MQDITVLSEQLQNAVKTGDSVAIENCTKQIAKLVKEKEAAEQKEKDRICLEEMTKNLLEIAEKFPCLACGGKLKQYPGMILFACVDCKRQCKRSPYIKEEEDIQEYIKSEIANFKILIKKVIKIGKIKLDINDELTQINGKPFCVFQRLDYPRALACEYDRHYSHESLRSGHQDRWATDLLSVAELLGSMFGLSYENQEKLKIKIRDMPYEKRFLKKMK